MKTRRKSHRGKLWEARELSAARPSEMKSSRSLVSSFVLSISSSCVYYIVKKLRI